VPAGHTSKPVKSDAVDAFVLNPGGTGIQYSSPAFDQYSDGQDEHVACCWPAYVPAAHIIGVDAPVDPFNGQ